MKFLHTFFVGFILTFAVVFIIFTGIYSGYFKFYGIDEYFNAVFIDNVPFLWLLPVCLLVGFLIFYTTFRKFLRILYLLILLCAMSLWHPELGLKFGKILFMQNPQTISLGNGIDMSVRQIYNGRNKFYLLKENEQVLKIKK